VVAYLWEGKICDGGKSKRVRGKKKIDAQNYLTGVENGKVYREGKRS